MQDQKRSNFNQFNKTHLIPKQNPISATFEIIADNLAHDEPRDDKLKKECDEIAQETLRYFNKNLYGDLNKNE